MTDGDRIALEALNSRLDHTAAIARLVRDHAHSLPASNGDLYDAIGGVAATIEELSERIDAILNPPPVAA